MVVHRKKHMDKEVYEKYIEEFIDEINDYIKGTKGSNINEYHDWIEMLKITEQFRVDMLSLLPDKKEDNFEDALEDFEDELWDSMEDLFLRKFNEFKQKLKEKK